VPLNADSTGYATGGAHTLLVQRMRVDNLALPESEPNDGCPAAGYSVYAMGGTGSFRRRYAVLGTDAGSALYVQSTPEGTADGVLGAPRLLVQGVEDMQIAWLLANPNSNTVAGCESPMCVCHSGTNGTGLTDGGFANCVAASNQGLIRGAEVRLSVLGHDPVQRTGAKSVQLFDSKVPEVRDDKERRVVNTQVLFRNLSMVTP
jgi:hypothetical protein